MVCRQDCTKPLSETMLVYCKLEPHEQTSVNSNWDSNILIQEKAFEYVVCQSDSHFVSDSVY